MDGFKPDVDAFAFPRIAFDRDWNPPFKVSCYCAWTQPHVQPLFGHGFHVRFPRRLLLIGMFLKGVLEEIETIEQMVRFANFNRGRGVHFRDWIFEFNGLVSRTASIALIAASAVLPARWARPFHVPVGQESSASIVRTS